MSIAVRIVVVVLILAVAVGVGLVARRRAGYQHPGIRLQGLNLEPGLVIFTATGCDSCDEARSLAARTGASVREVTNELESSLFARSGVVAVPLTVVVGRYGEIVRQYSGVPKASSLQRAVKKAGLA